MKAAQYELAALVPMRHASERVPGKNYRPFADGRPLFHHVVATLDASAYVDAIVIDTDSETIKQQCAEQFPEVIVIDRPEHLRGGMVPMNDVILHDIDQVPSRFYLQTHSTNPVLSSATLDRAIETFYDKKPVYDSLFGVTRVQTRFWTAGGEAINHDPSVLVRTQDLPPFFEENSCVYLFDAETVRRRGNRIGARPYLFEIDPLEAVDIDNEIDFEIAELVYARSRRSGPNA